MGEGAFGLLDWEWLDTRRSATARLSEERADIGDFALGVVLSDILMADTWDRPRESGAGFALETVLEVEMITFTTQQVYIAIRGDEMYVTDSNNNRVQKI